jgi:hypothetical protein
LLLKSLKWPTILAMLPIWLLAEIISWGFVLLKDRANIANKWRAYSSILADWQAIMRKRRAAQSLRRVRDRELLKHTTFRLEFEQAAAGPVAALARIVFNPVFFALRAMTLLIVWWEHLN